MRDVYHHEPHAARLSAKDEVTPIQRSGGSRTPPPSPSREPELPVRLLQRDSPARCCCSEAGHSWLDPSVFTSSSSWLHAAVTATFPTRRRHRQTFPCTSSQVSCDNMMSLPSFFNCNDCFRWSVLSARVHPRMSARQPVSPPSTISGVTSPCGYGLFSDKRIDPVPLRASGLQLQKTGEQPRADGCSLQERVRVSP